MSEPNDGKGPKYALVPAVRKARVPFDDKTRAEFLAYIRMGVRSRAQAAKLCGVHLKTVDYWIAKGRPEEYPDEDFEFRMFFIQLQKAEAERGSIADTTLARYARDDWRAAEAYAKRQDAIATATARRASVESEAEIKAQQARMAKIQADLVERKLRVVAGRFVFAQEALDTATEDERRVLRGLFERRGLVRVEPQDVEEEMQQTRDPVEDAEMEELAQRWGLEGPGGGG